LSRQRLSKRPRQLIFHSRTGSLRRQSVPATPRQACRGIFPPPPRDGGAPMSLRVDLDVIPALASLAFAVFHPCRFELCDFQFAVNDHAEAH